jgi:hypothetical protein
MSLNDLLKKKIAAVARSRVDHHVARVDGFGSRIVRSTSAAVAQASSKQSAIGVGPHSVWDGPKHAATPGGAPILKRARIA